MLQFVNSALAAEHRFDLPALLGGLLFSSTDIIKHLFRCSHSPILCLFENREPAEIGIGKEQWRLQSSQFSALLVEDCTGLRPGHRMAHAHNVDS